MRKSPFTLALLSLFLLPALAQTAAPAPAGRAEDRGSNSSTLAAERLQLAVSSIEYPVTPSDIYSLTYHQAGGDLVARDIQVSGDYSIDLGLFGQMDGRGLSFLMLKQSVESLIAKSYARSYPSISIIAVGVFRVAVEGNYSRLSYVSAWGLSRVSDVLEAAEPKGASLRNIELKRRNATPIHYDDLRARAATSPGEDPLVRPGDAISLFPEGRSVHLSGEVRRNGDFELLPGEGLRDLIEVFGGGAKPSADLSHVRIVRLAHSGTTTEYQSLPAAYDSLGDIGDCISVTLSSMADPLPVVWFEGAVLPARQDTKPDQTAAKTGAAAAPTPAFEASTRFSCPITAGQLLSETLLAIRDRLSSMADLASATLVRTDGQSIPVNLQTVLSSKSPATDIVLRDNDRILIPTLVVSVAVTGAVISPGTFPYQPGSLPAYYIGMAGGTDPLRNSNGAFSLTTSMGQSRSESEGVQPGDRIYLPENTAGITVSGAINHPGMFPFQPGYPASYYINRAGGIDPERNNNAAYWVTEQNGKNRRAAEPLSAGDRIYVPTNAFGYNALRYGPFITSLLALATTLYTFFRTIP